ncbi:MAG: hypothetical protein Q7V01_00255 [Vicinamibacterales bacterium]|nr:hypothetical protein [Vicinamibacterales bacterium]
MGSAVMAGALLFGAPAWAQAPVPPAASGADPQRGQRYQLAVMEGVLEAAVQQGARVVSRQWRAVSPDVLFMSGNARAHGFRLDNYGVFFNVEVPSMSQTFIYTWRLLERDAAGAAALRVLKGNLKAPAELAQRKELEQALRLLERQVGPSGRAPGGQDVMGRAQRQADGTLVTLPGGAPRPIPERAAGPDVVVDELPTEDPNAAYTGEVKDALIDAMLDHSHALTITPDEWLTVAAHDASDRQLGAADAYDAVTMLIRIKGADLQAFRAGRLSRADARQRIEIREY